MDYSIIVETENLSAADADRLWACLASIETAIENYSAPNEAIVFDTGKAPADLLKKIDERFPWLKIRRAPDGQGYYDCKMYGAHMATGDVIVLADSDCQYNADWLRYLVEPLADPHIGLVAGETGIQGSGAYALAIAMTYPFDGFSHAAAPDLANGYYANNVAFRRTLLLDVPIPDYLPAYRNACYVHGIELRHRGVKILRQPRSRASHARPENLSHFITRFFLSGTDRTVRKRCSVVDDAPKIETSSGSIIGKIWRRSRRRLTNDPREWLSLPIALLIAGSAWALEAAGLVIGYLFPDTVIRLISKMDGVNRPSVAEARANHRLAIQQRPGSEAAT